MSQKSLPDEWLWTTLADVGEIFTGRTPSKKIATNFGNFIPFVKPPELVDSVITNAVDNLSEKGVKDARILPENSVLVSCIGILGKTGINKVPVAFNQQINAIIFNERVLPKFGFFYFQSAEARQWLNAHASATTVTIINKSKFSRAPFPLPPFHDQERIVAKVEELFSQLDAGVEALKRVQTGLKRYRASVLKAAVEGRLVPQDPNDEPAEEMLRKLGKKPLEREDLPELPKGWCWTKIEELSKVVRGASPRPAGNPLYFGGNIPWITVGNLTADESPYITTVNAFVTDAGRRKSRYVGEDTLLITNSGATLGVPKITKIAGCFNDGVVAMLEVDHPLKLFLYYYLKSKTEDLRRINQGAAQPNLNTGLIKAINVALPPSLEQERIIAEIEQRFSLILELEVITDKAITRASRLRQSILKQAFEGKLLNDNYLDKSKKHQVNNAVSN